MRWIVRPRVLAGILLGLISLYALIGFFLLPSLIKTYVVPAAADRLKHPIFLREVALNPFALSLRLNGLEVREVDQTAILGFEELFVDLRATTLFLQSVGFDEIRLVMPFVSAKVNREGKLNLLALVPPSDEQSKMPPSQKAPLERKKMMPVEIESLQIDQGILEFRDESKVKPVTMDIVPIHISLRNFSTVQGSENAYAFTAEIGKGEAVAWEGTISLEPLESDGKLSLTGVKVQTLYQAVQDRFQFDVRNGQLAMAGTYHFDLRSQAPSVTVKDGTLSIQHFAIGERGGGGSVVDIPVFDVEGIGFDLAKKSVTIGKVHSADARFESWIDPEGVLNYQQLFTPVGGGQQKQAPPAETASEPWSIAVGEVAFGNYRAIFEDRTLARPSHVEVEALNLTVKDAQVPFKAPLPVDLSMKLNQTGLVSMRGRIAVEPLMADLDLTLKQIGIRPFQPYFDRFVDADVRDGVLDLIGTLHYAKDHPKGPLLRFQGNVAVKQLSITDRTEFDDVVSWKSLAVNRVALDVEPTAVKIGEVVWQEPAAHLVVESDGRLNLSHLLAPAPQEEAAIAKKDVQQNPPPKPSRPVTVTIDTVKLVKAAATFRDLSIEPAVHAGITELSGTIKGLSSKEIAKADVALTGKVDGTAPLKISGQINPLTEDAFTDLTVVFDNVDLTAASPYAGKYAGYPISDGKLFLDLKYKIAKKSLVGENKVLIDQLTFGEKTNSPDATSLPVPLAVALLKDRKGQIDVDLPVRGDLNDPDFKYGRVLLNTLLNLLAKVATSPLSLLGGLVGGSGDELQFIEFLPGQSSLSEAELKKLGTLEKVLVERPGLFLEISGSADPKRDRLVLAEGKFMAQLRQMKRQESGQAIPREGEEPSINKEEEARLIEEWYAKQFEGQATAPKQEMPVAEKRERLVAMLSIEEGELRTLAQNRATGIRERLLQRGTVPEERLVVREVQIKEEAGSVIQTRLTLAGR